MKWKKLGLVYCPDGDSLWAKTNAMIPTPVRINDEIIRVFITSCDKNGLGRPGFVDVLSSDPSQVVEIGSEPLLDIGQDGAFDENGCLTCSVAVLPDGQMYMYYAGFELGTKIRYRLLTGLAIKNPGQIKFTRFKQVPVLERTDDELFFRAGPFVMFEDGRFRMWYVAGCDWETVQGMVKPVYDIRYAESKNGIEWPDKGISCIKIEKENEHGFGRPYVIRDGDLYKMFYSVRRSDLGSYRLGYAESPDGINWDRKDDSLEGLDVSKDGWDSEMICYTAVMKIGGDWFMFYNGNNFGESGFGLAILES